MTLSLFQVNTNCNKIVMSICVRGTYLHFAFQRPVAEGPVILIINYNFCIAILKFYEELTNVKDLCTYMDIFLEEISREHLRLKKYLLSYYIHYNICTVYRSK